MAGNQTLDPSKSIIVLGVDVGRGDDYTHFTIFDNVNEEVLYSGTDPDEIRKYQIASVQIDEQDVRLWADNERN